MSSARCGLSPLPEQWREVNSRGARYVAIIGFGDLEEVVDRLFAIKHTDLDAVPPLVFPSCLVRCRCDHAQSFATRHKYAKVVDVLDVVEDDESVRRFARPQVVQAAADDLLLCRLVARVDLQSFCEFDQSALEGFWGCGIHPRDEAPV